MFSQVDISLNDMLISNSTNTYPYRAMLLTLLSYGGDAKTLLSCEMHYKDMPVWMEATRTQPDSANEVNTGLQARRAHII